MSRATVAQNQRVSPSYTRLSDEPRIDQRICLWCNWWMRSASAAHRKCNHCKRDFGGSPMRVGNRIRPVEGLTWTDPLEFSERELSDEFANVLHLGMEVEK